MKLTDVSIDGFGVWSGFALRDLSPQCTVFYGPNEAGKTTLREFIRAVLYGFSPPRRMKYLPPLLGGAAGGTLVVSSPEGAPLRICRRDDASQALGAVDVTSTDGRVPADNHLERLLLDVDESTFQNVFALGLFELQELGTLNDTDAAQWLYSLTAGFDRVSVCDVLRELAHSRSMLLCADDQPCQVRELLRQRDSLDGEIGVLSNLARQYGELIDHQSAGADEIARLEESVATLDTESQTVESCVLVYDVWQRRTALQAQIEAIRAADSWPSDALLRMDHVVNALGRRRRQLQKLKLRRRQLRQKANQITFSDAVLRQAPRISALAEHDSWIVSLEHDCSQAEAAVKALTDERTACLSRWFPASGSLATPSVPADSARRRDKKSWRSLRPRARALAQAHRNVQRARLAIDEQRGAAALSNREVQAALAKTGQNNLTAALDLAGRRVTELRHRLQLDEQIDKLADTKTDLQEQITGLIDRQILPPWMLVSLGCVFVLGVVLTLAGLLLPGSFVGGLGWPMAWLGILGTGSAVVVKYVVERSYANQLNVCRRQLEQIESQLDEAQTDREEADRTSPDFAAPQSLLQSAQEELGRLEALMPLDVQRRDADQATLAAEAQLKLASQGFQNAAERWRSALSAAGLPANLKPREARAMLRAHRDVEALDDQLTAAQFNLERARRELSALAGRIEQVFLAANLPPQSDIASDRLRQLRTEITEQEARREHRDAVLAKLHAHRQRHRRIQRRIHRLRRRRSRLLSHCRVGSLAEFRSRANEYSQLAALTGERDAAAHEIAVAISPATSESTIADRMAGRTVSQLEADLASATQERDAARNHLHRLLEQRGARAEQLRRLSTDRQLAVKRFERSQIENQLAAVMRRWQVLTMTERVLQHVKDDYERNRQPEALRDASEYLAQFTEGRYRRVWTRFGENALLVDDESGNSLPIEVLSHGTREQLFLALRMALVGLFARRGAELPMVLDDVFVNFDAQRAAAAVESLKRFAERGHQLLIFTCHEHLARLFKSRGVDVRRLPDRTEPSGKQTFEFDLEPPPRRLRARKIKEEVPSPEPVETPPKSEPDSLPSATLSPPRTSVATVRPVEPKTPPSPVPSVPQLRVDLPQRPVRLSPIMRRWAAEEFSGELDDRVNPVPLLKAQLAAPALATPVEEQVHDLMARDGLAIRTSRTAISKIFGAQPAPVVVDAHPGEEDWEL